jgi:SpoVK/Ycf46/Vps4 family AAA+-type ATPase
LLNITASTIFSKWLGDSNKTIHAIFTLARKMSALGMNTLVFIDEVDTILGDMNMQESEYNQQVKAEFMQLWDGLLVSGVTVVGATNQPHKLNDAVWRRFSSHLEVRQQNHRRFWCPECT